MGVWSSWKTRSGRDKCYRIVPKSLGTGNENPDCALISSCRILHLMESRLLYHRELGGAFVWLCLLVYVYSVKPGWFECVSCASPIIGGQVCSPSSCLSGLCLGKNPEKWEPKCIPLRLLSFTCSIILVQIRHEMLLSRREAFCSSNKVQSGNSLIQGMDTMSLYFSILAVHCWGFVPASHP